MVADICPKCKNMDTVVRLGSNHYTTLVTTDYVCPDCLTRWVARFFIEAVTVTSEE